MMSGIFAGLLLGGTFASAYATAPTIKLTSAALVSPSSAWNNFYASSTTHTQGVAAWQNGRPPEIKKLARSLGATRYQSGAYAQRVFDYVRTNIETEFRFGLGKGARGAALDQYGTPFDQANLMVELLREGGISASYQLGLVTLNATEFGLWSGLVYNLNQATQTFSVDAHAACTLLADGGIPATVNGASSCTSLSGPLTSVTFLHVWVMVSVNGSNNLYDPSYKQHLLKTGVDLAATMGCGSSGSATCGSTINSAGLQGATQGTLGGASYIQNVNRAAVESQLNTYATRLQTNTQSTDRFAQVEDVAGGAVIKVNYSPTVSSNLPYATQQGSPLATWSADIPDKFRTTLNVQFLGINSPAIYLDELYGQRLRVATLGPANTWTRTSTLYVEGNAIATATYAAEQGTQDIVTLSINHPYAASASGSTTLDGTYADENVVLYAGQDYRDGNRNYVYTGGGSTGTVNDAWPNAITVIWSLGRTGQGYQNLMTQLHATGGDELSLVDMNMTVPEQHPSEAAGILIQQAAAARILENASKSRITEHHTLGVAFSIYRDGSVAGMFNMDSMASVTNSVSNSTDRQAAFSTYSLMGATLEGSVPQQTEDGWDASSAVSLLWNANEDHEQFLAVNSSNFAAVWPTLSANGYSTTRQNNLSQYLSAGYQVILPSKNSPPCVSMTGGTACPTTSGEIFSTTNELGYAVAERLKGDASIPSLDPVKGVVQQTQLQSYSLRDRHAFTLDASTGTIRLTPPPDLQIGSGPYPASLHFQRTYSSAETSQESCSITFDTNSYGYLCDPVTEGTYQTTLGNGWRHNFQISAEWSNNGLEAFGLTTGLRASTAIASIYTLFDLARTQGLPQSLASVMVAHATAVSLMKNSFVIHLPEKTLTFVKLPDGTYDSPINEPSAQITVSGTRSGPFMFSTSIFYDYSGTTLQYRSSHGDVMNFAWNFMAMFQAGNIYGLARPSYDIQDWTTPEGIKVQFTYTNVDNISGGRRQRVLTKVSNNLGHSLSFNGSTPSTTISLVADETGRQVSYSTSGCTENPYTERNNANDFSIFLEDCRGTFSVTQADGQVSSYSYMPDSSSPDPVTIAPTLRLRKWFTPSSSTAPFLTITYDQEMNVQTVVDAQGAITSVYAGAVADEIDRAAEVQDPLGAVTRTYFDRYSDPLIVIDPLGRTTLHFYDDARRLTQTIYPEKNGVNYTYDVRSNLLTTTTFSKPGTQVPSVLGPVNTYYEGPTVRTCSNLVTCNEAHTITDANQNTTTVNYSGSTGQLLSVTGPALTHGISGNPTTTYCYTSYGTTNSDGTTSTPVSLLTGKIEQVTSSSTRVTSYGYNTGNHLVLSSATVDPTATLAAGSTGSLSCPGSSKSGALNLVTSYAFDSVGNLQSISGPRTDVSDLRSYSFDKMRRLTRIVEPSLAANGSGPTPITRYTYDVDGELVSTRHSIVASPADADPTNPWPSLTAAQWQTETRTYWPTGDLKSVQDANGNTTQYAYDSDGRLVMTTDPDGRIKATVYDAAGEALCVWKGWNSASPPGSCSWNPASYTDGAQPLLYSSVAYTNNGEQQSVTDSNGKTTQYVYDGLDRLGFTLFPDPDNGTLCSIGTTFPSGTVPTCSARQTYEQYGYDNNGNRTSLRTRKGDVIATTYNPLNLPDTKTPPDLPAVSYTYYLSGDAMSIAQGAHSTGYAYDAAGRKHTETNDSLSVTYGYDQAGNRASTLWPDGYQVSYIYNAVNAMQDVHEGTASGALLAHYDYDILKRRQTLTYGGNSANTIGYFYEPDSRLSSLTHQMGSAALTLGYSHNGSGQITNLSVSDGFYLPKPTTPATTGYGINGLNEYTAVGAVTGTDSSGKPVISGARGRIISIPFDDLQIVFPAVAPGRTPVDTSADPGGNTVVHDLSGNLRRWTGPDGKRNFYTYDSENRLRTATTSAHTISYDYDAQGRRISKTVDGVQTGFLLDGDEEIAEYNMSNGAWPSTPARRYVMGPAIDERVATVDATNGNAKAYYHINHQGSVLATTDSSGNVIQRLSYDEYGNAGPGSTITGQVFRYTGRRFDAETGLYYYRARYYAPQLGQFLQTDPVGYKDDVNLYSYVGNDPLDKTDPSGTCSAGALRFAAAAVVGGGGPEDPIGDFAGAAGLVGSCLWRLGGAVAAAMAANELVHQNFVLPADTQGTPPDPQDPFDWKKGPQTTSATVWRANSNSPQAIRGARVDLENPNPGQRDGQIHLQIGDEKWIYRGNGQWQGATKTTPKLTNAQLKALNADTSLAEKLKKLEQLLRKQGS